MWFTSMDPTAMLLLFQFVAQVILLGIVLVFIFMDKKRKIPTSILDELKDVIQETSKLSDNFRDQVQAKADLVSRIMNELDEKIKEARLVIEGLEKTNTSTKETRKYTQADVVRLFKGGFDPVDISQITGIPIGEVQLMVKLNP